MLGAPDAGGASKLDLAGDEAVDAPAEGGGCALAEGGVDKAEGGIARADGE